MIIIRRISILFFIFFMPFFIHGQTFVEKHLDAGIGVSMIESEDHNFILLSNLADQIHVIKVDSSGSEIWNNQFGYVYKCY